MDYSAKYHSGRRPSGVSKNLVIIGNSGAARECYWLARDCVKAGQDMVFKGFLAFEGHVGNLAELSSFLLGNDDAYISEPDDVFAIGIGQPALRCKAYAKWKKKGAEFINLIHPTVPIIGDVRLGEGNIIACASYISCNSTLGNANYLNGSVVVGHDVIIGDCNFFGTFSLILGGARVGDRNSFAIHSAAMPGAHVGNDNTILPATYIYKGCRDGKVMAGNPAVNIKD